MATDILVNAGDLESRVAIIVDGKLAELHVEREPRIVGNIYKGKITNILPGMDAAFIDVGLGKNAFLTADDVVLSPEEEADARPGRRDYAPIAQRLKVSQEVLVQVARAPVGTKGARVTTRLAFPGRYLVLLADSDHVGVSRKIENEKERDRLRGIAEEIRPENRSLIVRTEAEGRGKRELQADLKFLLEVQAQAEQKAAASSAPALIHQDLSLAYHMVRDYFTADVKRLIIDSPDVHQQALDLVSSIALHLKKRVILYNEKTPLFAKYGIEEEIDRLLRRRVWLAAGGYLTIDQAEAFTAIDVNTGRYTGGAGLAETILHTNLEAAREVARQLRLRDLGGIIVIDFIDMDKASHRSRVTKALTDALKEDRMKTKILHLSPLGLIEMTRKRHGKSLSELLTEPCPTCAGVGRLRQPLTIALRIERELARQAAESSPPTFIVRTHARVGAILFGPRGERLTHLEDSLGAPVYLRSYLQGQLEEFAITPAPRAEIPNLVTLYQPGQQLEGRPLAPDVVPPGDHLLVSVEGYWVSLNVPPDRVPGDATVCFRLITAGRSFGEGEFIAATGAQPSLAPPSAAEAAAAEAVPARRGRRRHRKPAAPAAQPEPAPAPTEALVEVAPSKAPAAKPEAVTRPSRPRRRRHKRTAAPTVQPGPAPAPTEAPAPAAAPEAAAPEAAVPSKSSRSRRRRRHKKPTPPTQSEVPPAPAEPAAPVVPVPETVAASRPSRPRRRRRRKTAVSTGQARHTSGGQASVATPPAEAAEPAAPVAASVGKAAAGKPARRPRRRRHRKPTSPAARTEGGPPPAP